MDRVKLDGCSLQSYALNNGVIMLTVVGVNGNFTEIQINRESLERLKILSQNIERK